MIAPVEQNTAVQALRGFHDDEDGMETLQVVMLVGIAAIILIVLKLFWGQVKEWVHGEWQKVKTNSNNEETFN